MEHWGSESGLVQGVPHEKHASSVTVLIRLGAQKFQ